MIDLMKFCFGLLFLAGIGVCVCAVIVGFDESRGGFTLSGLRSFATTSDIFFTGFFIALASTVIWVLLDWHSRRFSETQTKPSPKM